MTKHNSFDVVVVGGGITGLAAAWSLQQQLPSPTYAVLESSDRWGGKILTDKLPVADGDSFVIEGGPDSFITQKPWALQLARSLGMADRLLPTNDAQRQVFVLNRGRPVPLPDGVMLIVPTKLTPFALSPLISLRGKLRMGMDWFVEPKLDGEDETLADFITRRLGPEALDKIAEPLLAGIYNAEAERQSIMATFPRFRAIEEKHGSLIRGMLAAKKMRAEAAPSNGQAPPSAFVSFRHGMSELVETLLSRLDGTLELSARVEHIALEKGGYQLTLADGRTLSAATIILATPSYVAAELLEPMAPEAASGLEAIRYVSTGTVSLAYRRDTLGHPLNGFGIVIPRSEERDINAITWTSTKFDHRAPEGHALLRVFFGGSRTPHMMDVSDDDLLRVVRSELQAIMGIDDTPVSHHIYRWHRANPQYDVGHLDRVTVIESQLPPGIFLAGSAYRGIGIPDCVRQGTVSALAATEYVASDQKPAEESIQL